MAADHVDMRSSGQWHRMSADPSGHSRGMDLSTDLAQILLVTFGTPLAIAALLFVMASLDPRTDRRRPAQTQVLRATPAAPTAESSAVPTALP